MTRILIVDAHPVVRNGIRAILSTEADFEVVGEAGDGREAIAAFKAHAPDVVLMDLKMPKMEGPDAIAAIVRQYPEARIVVLTTFDGDEDIHRALSLGALGYVLKDAAGSEIVAAVRAAHAGKRHVSADAAKSLAERPMGRDVTDREIQVLEGIARGKSNKEIGDELSISEATVKSHVNAILSKLEANDRTHAAMIALKRGLIR